MLTVICGSPEANTWHSLSDDCNPVCPGEIGAPWRLCLFAHLCRNYYSVVFEDQAIVHGQFLVHIIVSAHINVS